MKIHFEYTSSSVRVISFRAFVQIIEVEVLFVGGYEYTPNPTVYKYSNKII